MVDLTGEIERRWPDLELKRYRAVLAPRVEVNNPRVGRTIVDDDDLNAWILLIQHRVEASLDKSAAVIGYDRNRNEVAKGHLFEPGLPVLGIFFSNPFTHSLHCSAANRSGVYRQAARSDHRALPT